MADGFSAPEQTRQTDTHWRGFTQRETLQQPSVVGTRMADITRAGRGVADRWQLANHFAQRLEHLLESRGFVQANIDRPLFNLSGFDSLNQDLYQVANVDEVPGLLAIAKNGDWQALYRTLAEDADDAGVRR